MLVTLKYLLSGKQTVFPALFVKSFVLFDSFRNISARAGGVKVGKADKTSENGIVCFGRFFLVKKCCHMADFLSLLYFAKIVWDIIVLLH